MKNRSGGSCYMNDVHDGEDKAKKGNGKDKEELNASTADASAEATEPVLEDDESENMECGDQVSGEGELVEELSPEEQFHRLLKEKDELLAQKHDRLLRAQADYENYKKRIAREKEDLYKFGNERLLKELLPILDNFERSLTHAKESKSLAGVVEGVELIRKEMINTLKKYGLSEISAKGEKFDPSMHEATAQVPSSDHSEGTVMEELQKGYFVHDRLLRPAMVVVAGPPVEPQKDESEE